MKPFNLEQAKAGAPVQTRDGRPVRIICTDRKSEQLPIVALVDAGNTEWEICYSAEGRNMRYTKEDDSDLVMATVKRSGWVAMLNNQIIWSEVYPTKEALMKARIKDWHDVNFVEIHWEE
jgi:hypothetical protein